MIGTVVILRIVREVIVMPVLKKEIELDDGRKVWVRQASGMDKLRIENIQARTFRKFRELGADPNDWTPEQHEAFADALDEAGGGLTDQVETWLPKCILDKDVDIDTLTGDEIRTILNFVRGDTLEGAIPLASCAE